MTNNDKIMAYKARIELLRARAGRENGNIIKKLERKIRAAEKKSV